MSRFLKIVVGVVILLVAIVAFVLFHRFDSPGLGQKIGAALKDATGIELQASAFSLQLAHGLSATEVRLAASTPGGRIELKADQILFSY